MRHIAKQFLNQLNYFIRFLLFGQQKILTAWISLLSRANLSHEDYQHETGGEFSLINLTCWYIIATAQTRFSVHGKGKVRP